MIELNKDVLIVPAFTNSIRAFKDVKPQVQRETLSLFFIKQGTDYVREVCTSVESLEGCFIKLDGSDEDLTNGWIYRINDDFSSCSCF